MHEVVVIGAGSAGAVVAARLSESPSLRVVLLEAGRDYPRFEDLPLDLKRGTVSAALGTPEHLWGLVARATAAQEPAPLPRGKVIGGTGAINGALYVRALPDDFARWVNLGNDRWSFEDVLPVYRRTERDVDFPGGVHGTYGPIPVRRYPRESWNPLQRAFYAACRDAGYPDCPDMNDPTSTGIGPFPMNNLGDIRASTALTHLAPARARANLTIRANCRARRLLLNGDSVEAVEVEIDGATETIRGEQFIVCGGAIGSPQLLLLSGIGPPAVLARAGIPVLHELRGVGQSLRDHQVVDMKWNTAPGHQLLTPEAPGVQIALRYTATGSSLFNDMKITARAVTRAAAGAPPAEGIVSIVPDLELAYSHGTVEVSSPDPRKPPSIELNFLGDDRDRTRLREGVRLALELSRHPSFKGILADRVTPSDADTASDDTIDDWMMRVVRTSHHLCSSCRMGPASDPFAVTDQFGRVHGLDNLRIADASIFADVVRANTNATAILVGERIAEFVRTDLGAALESVQTDSSSS